MDHVTIGDGCSIQASVICSNVQLQDRVVLKDCQVKFLSQSSNHYVYTPLAAKLQIVHTLLISVSDWSRFCGHC